MASINYATREISCKIVYYGPGLSGKTTNLQIIHRKIPDKDKSEMVSLATETDRTLFFDFLPLDLGSIKGFATKFQLYTVPGQVYYNATRKLVLRGVDGVVFVVDSQADKLQENLESFQNLQENLREYGHSIETIPVVLQFNKRDLPNIYSIDQLNSLVNKYGMPYFEAVASTGVGVFTTLKGIGKAVIDKFNAKYSGFQGSRRPAGSPAAAANAVPPAPPRPQPQPPMAQPAYQAPQPAQPQAPQYPPAYSAPAAPAPGGFPGPGPLAPLSSAPMGSNSPLGPFQTPSANPFQTQPSGLGAGPSSFGGQGGPGGFPPAAQPGPGMGQPPGQFVPPTGGGKPFPGFGNAPPMLGQPPQSSQPGSMPNMGGPGMSHPAPHAPHAPQGGQPSPFNNPFNSAPSNPGANRSPFGAPPSGMPQPGGMGQGPLSGPGPQIPSHTPPQVPLAPQVENFGRPAMPSGIPNAPMAPMPFAPPGGMQNPMGASPYGQSPAPNQNPSFGAPSPSPFGAPPMPSPGSSPFGAPMPGPGQAPSSAPFGGGPSPFSGSGMNSQGGFQPPMGNPGVNMGAPGGQAASPFGNPPNPLNPPHNPSPFGNKPAFGGPGGPPMGGPLGNAPANPAPRPPGPGDGFQQPGYGNPGGYNASSGPMPMPPLGDVGGADNHSGIVSTYEDMQRDDNFKTRKIPLPSEKKKGFFDGLFKKDA